MLVARGLLIKSLTCRSDKEEKTVGFFYISSDLIMKKNLFSIFIYRIGRGKKGEFDLK